MVKPPQPPAWILLSKIVAQHQGLGMLARKLDEANVARHIGWNPSVFNKALYKILMKVRPGLGTDRESAHHKILADHLARRHGETGRVAHLAWGDNFLTYVRRPERHVFTLHLPYERWNDSQWAAILKARGIVTMAERDRVEILHRLPRGQVACILHGVDLDFWRPAAPDSHAPPIVCICGRFMRNYEMIIRVAVALLRRRADVQIRWLLNPDFVMPPEIAAQLPADRLKVVRNLSVQELRTFYQQSTLFFTPYDSVTASNSIVEALACGLPMVTTRVGGMNSYGGDDALILVDNNDDDGALAALEKALDDHAWRAERGARARAFAERNLSWDKIVDEHRKFYSTLGVT